MPDALRDLSWPVFCLTVILQPLRSQPDCTPRVSDHCILDITLAAP